ncbi:centriole, cilia and spindle-associated protein [Etheostoma cragini]|uniref:centriole, cilia and spindle-associated protein n=1 Tax=Etheostoma cragini TaxID=417921 RepID=UPI00155E15B9|nr:centriole, cilia and spindle-associated protein [Etheostoma cragini]
MVTKKIRTEYMKKFRDPRWETFSKCYEDSLKYRLTRRVMEHSHKPWIWEGWDSGSESSGWSTPRLNRNKIAPLSLPPPPPMEGKQSPSNPGPKPPAEDGETEEGVGEAPVGDAAATPEVVENGVNEASGGSEDSTIDSVPADTTSSDGEAVNPVPKRRHRRRTPRSEPGRRDGSHDDKPPVVRKPARAKSTPPIIAKETENRRTPSRLDWNDRQTEVRRTPNDSNTSDACVQTRRQSGKRGSAVERRRARSADLEKTRRSQLTVADDRWMTEYMRCFSARLR